MASTSKVVPGKGHVHDVHSRLMAALDIDEGSQYQKEMEDVREMRFVLRKFMHSVMELAESGSGDKGEYFKAARTAGEVDYADQSAESIGSRTADILCSILEDAPWGFEKGRAQEEQDVNVSLKGIKDGIKVTIDTLSVQLEEDGTEGDEYEQDGAASKAPKTPTKSRKPASTKSTPSQTPKGGAGNFNHGSARRWTNEESLESLRIVRDFPGTHNERAAELQRRMVARGQATGDPRGGNAFRLQVRKLNDAGTTVKDLEVILGEMGGDGEED